MPLKPLPTDAFAASRWTELILRRCGLSVRQAQVPVLDELLAARMSIRGVDTLAAYYDLLEAEADGGGEWTAIVERLVSRETSFFRHPASFEAVRKSLLPELRSRQDIGGSPLTLLSAGCSTGQEAYSLAMVAMGDQDGRPDFTVCGIDISRRSIEAARRGRYRSRSAATVPTWCRHRYLRTVADAPRTECEVVDEIRQRVRFIAMNLYTACRMFLNYDVIFCHNVLIYFAPSAAVELMALLGSRLNLGGFLVPGPGEAPVGPLPGLEPVTVDGVRAFRRTGRRANEVRP